MIEIAERRLDGGRSGDVDAVHRNRAPDRIQRVGRTDEAADSQTRQAKRFRKRPPDNDVRVRRQVLNEGLAGELRIGFVDKDNRAVRNAGGERANGIERHRDAGRVVRVGEEHHTRVRRDGRQHLGQREAEIGVRHHLYEPSSGDRGVEAEDLERRLRHDRFGHGAARRRSQTGDRQRHDAFVEPVRQRDLVGRHAEIGRNRAGRTGVRRIETNLVRAQGRQRRQHARRAAAGVLVLMEPEPVVQLRGLLIMTHFKRISIDSA